MKTAICHLKSISPYSQSKCHETEELSRELPDDYEKRTWMEKAHVNSDGFVFIPPTMFKNSIAEAAKYLSLKVPGKGKATFTKNFEAGILVVDPLVLPIKKNEMQFERVFGSVNGIRGGNKRVWKYFPIVPEWEGKVTYIIVDDLITESVFERHVKVAGQLVGIGRWRPRNNGLYGRYELIDMKWIEQ